MESPFRMPTRRQISFPSFPTHFKGGLPKDHTFPWICLFDPFPITQCDLLYSQPLFFSADFQVYVQDEEHSALTRPHLGKKETFVWLQRLHREASIYVVIHKWLNRA